MSGLTVEQIMALANNSGGDAASAKGTGARDLPKARIEILNADGTTTWLATVTVQYASFAVKQAHSALDSSKPEDSIAFVGSSNSVFVRAQFETQLDTSEVRTGSLAAVVGALTKAGDVA